MDAIKKKMQAMKIEKDAAMDKADTCEGQAKDANLRADKVSVNISALAPSFNLPTKHLLNIITNSGDGGSP